MLLGIATLLRFARKIVTPPKEYEYPVRILGIDRANQQIVLNDTPGTRLPGRYGLWFGRDAGYLRFGDVVAQRPGRVVRELEELVSGTPRTGLQARDVGWFYLGPWELGLDYREVHVQTELGPAPAWWVQPNGRARAGDWVIHVHGRTAERPETLRAVSVAAAAGYQSLVISYRNDRGAPRSPDGRYALGLDEAKDVIASLRFAKENGAERVVLWGWSMGGLAVLCAALAAQRTEGLPLLTGIVLESPALNWPNILEHHAKLLRLPGASGAAVATILASRFAPHAVGLAQPLNWDELDGVRIGRELPLPILMLHSAADPYVPVAPADELGRAKNVQYERFETAGHTRLWNFDPERWERVTREFLDAR